MTKLRVLLTVLIGTTLCLSAAAQRGSIIQPATSPVLDPNQDGYISETNAGFSNDGYYPDEFEIQMFGIPVLDDGEALNDTQVGPACGTTDLTNDSEGHAAYAGLDANNNLIFRLRLADEHPSVESYTVLIDTDGKIGPSDPNATGINPGFEIDITLIDNSSKGINVYDIDGIESCPTPLLNYGHGSNFQVSIGDLASCGDEDYFYDFFVPFDDLATTFGISLSSKIQFAVVTNISGTCAMAGTISDIGGVDDNDYAGCIECAFEDLAAQSCPITLEDLAEGGEGFLAGATPEPTMNIPLKEGDQLIKGTAAPDADVFLDVFTQAGVLIESTSAVADVDSLWNLTLAQPLQQGDSVTAVAQIAGSCDSQASGSQVSFAVVVLNTPPQLNGEVTALPYTENDGSVPVDPIVQVLDNEDFDLESATVAIISNFLASEDQLTFTDQNGISGTYDSGTGILNLTGEASLEDYQTALASIGYENTSENPDLSTRTVSFIVFDGTENSNTFTRDIQLARVNDAPVLNGTPGSTEYLWAPQIINNTIDAADVDDIELTGAVISIGNNFTQGDDQLIFSDQNGITGSYDAATGVLTLTGTALLSTYSTALNSISYENTGAIELTRRIDFSVTDGQLSSELFSHFLFMTVTNSNPVIVDENDIPIDDVFININED